MQRCQSWLKNVFVATVSSPGREYPSCITLLGNPILCLPGQGGCFGLVSGCQTLLWKIISKQTCSTLISELTSIVETCSKRLRKHPFFKIFFGEVTIEHRTATKAEENKNPCLVHLRREVTCASQRSRNPANITQHMATEVEEALAANANVTCLVLTHFFGTWMNLYNGFLAISCPRTAPCSLLWPQAKRVCGCVSVKPMILVSVVCYVSVHPKSSKTVSCTNNTYL